MASGNFFHQPFGVEVAPQTPMELAPANRELSISSALSIKCELALTFLHSLNSILPLELFAADKEY